MDESMIFLELDLVTKTNWKSSLYVWVRREESAIL